MLTGVGLGIVCSGPLVGLLRPLGPGAIWLAFGLLSLALAVAAWPLWPASSHLRLGQKAEPARLSPAVVALLAAYGLNAAGLVPHMVFFVDYVVRGRGLGITAGAVLWTVYGLGAASAPILTGLVADRIGFRMTLLMALALQIVAVLAIFAPGLPALVASALIMGGFTPASCPWSWAAPERSSGTRGRPRSGAGPR